MFVEALDLLFSNLHEAGIDLSTVSAVLQITRCVCVSRFVDVLYVAPSDPSCERQRTAARISILA